MSCLYRKMMRAWSKPILAHCTAFRDKGEYAESARIIKGINIPKLVLFGRLIRHNPSLFHKLNFLTRGLPMVASNIGVSSWCPSCNCGKFCSRFALSSWRTPRTVLEAMWLWDGDYYHRCTRLSWNGIVHGVNGYLVGVKSVDDGNGAILYWRSKTDWAYGHVRENSQNKYMCIMNKHMMAEMIFIKGNFTQF